MRLLITGWQGQVAQSLVEVAAARKDVAALAIGRPAFDLVQPPTILKTLANERPDIVINTAAYTAVDKAESDVEAAYALNRDGAGLLAEATADLGIPLIHLSTDYVFDGSKPSAYVETDTPNPIGVYGKSKLQGELAVAAGNSRHVILRTAWVVSPFGQNFVKTMLRIGREKGAARVVGDQIGSPTYAPHLAAAILDIAARVLAAPGDHSLFGLFHVAGTGEASWHDVAARVFARAQVNGGQAVSLTAIATRDYPTAAARPANSRLDCGKLARVYGRSLPHWHEGIDACVDRLMAN